MIRTSNAVCVCVCVCLWVCVCVFGAYSILYDLITSYSFALLNYTDITHSVCVLCAYAIKRIELRFFYILYDHVLFSCLTESHGHQTQYLHPLPSRKRVALSLRTHLTGAPKTKTKKNSCTSSVPTSIVSASRTRNTGNLMT